MKLFFIERLNALPNVLKQTILFNMISGATISMEGVVIGIIQVEALPHWLIPLVGVLYVLVRLGVDKVSNISLTIIHRLVRITHVVGMVGWVLLFFLGYEWLWFLTVLWIIDTVLWGAESNHVTGTIAERYGDKMKEFRRVEMHNKVVPNILAGVLGSLALAISMDVAIILIMIANVLMHTIFLHYRKVWGKELSE